MSPAPDSHAKENSAQILQARRARQQSAAAAGGGRLTFQDALAVQFIPGDNHCVEVLGEAWSARRSERLACPAPLRTGGGVWGAREEGERRGEEMAC